MSAEVILCARNAGIEAGAVEVLRQPFVWPELLEHTRHALSAGANRGEE